VVAFLVAATNSEKLMAPLPSRSRSRFEIGGWLYPVDYGLGLTSEGNSLEINMRRCTEYEKKYFNI